MSPTSRMWLTRVKHIIGDDIEKWYILPKILFWVIAPYFMCYKYYRRSNLRDGVWEACIFSVLVFGLWTTIILAIYNNLPTKDDNLRRNLHNACYRYNVEAVLRDSSYISNKENIKIERACGTQSSIKEESPHQQILKSYKKPVL